MNDSPVDCQNASVTEPQRDRCHAKRDGEGQFPTRLSSRLSAELSLRESLFRPQFRKAG